MSNRLTVFSPNNSDPNASIPNNYPTLTVDPTLGSTISGSGIRCINFIGSQYFRGTVSIESGSLAVNQQLLLLNTSGSQPINISLDNGGLIAGVKVYALGSGSNLGVIFDGTNLNTQS